MRQGVIITAGKENFVLGSWPPGFRQRQPGRPMREARNITAPPVRFCPPAPRARRAACPPPGSAAPGSGGSPPAVRLSPPRPEAPRTGEAPEALPPRPEAGKPRKRPPPRPREYVSRKRPGSAARKRKRPGSPEALPACPCALYPMRGAGIITAFRKNFKNRLTI